MKDISKDKALLERMAYCVRFLSADMVQRANSGHPGVAMGLADVVSVLSAHLNLSPKNPQWLNRDRLVFSGGHASAMIYSLLHLWGFGVSLDDLKAFRQLDSKTPGHPEQGLTPGIEITTGPLGQGVANAVGFAIARRYAASLLNTQECELITHRVYCLCGDGDLQEGISYEACSLAGHLGLALTLIYDSNRITIEGDTRIAFSEDVSKRFVAMGWNVLECDGHDYSSIDSALTEAKLSPKPCLIIAHTQIAKGSKNLCGSEKSHGAPLGQEEIALSKEASGFCSKDDEFYIPTDVLEGFRSVQERGDRLEVAWQSQLKLASKEQKALLEKLLNPDFSSVKYPSFSEQSLATRSSNGQILNAIAQALPGFLGGSADLAPSNNTLIKADSSFPDGRNLHFGIREHSMGAICNAIASYGLFIPYCATFFVFSDYMIPAVRLAALMKSRCFYVWTHDSIGVGEDGATHQPIEQLTHLRSMPHLYTFRPADAYENVAAWQVALSLNAPCAFVLSRQNLPVLSPHAGVERGGYALLEDSNPSVVLLASGSEVHVCLKAAAILKEGGVNVRVVSVPCYELLRAQDSEYIEKLLPKQALKIAVEASCGVEWYAFCDVVFGMEDFGRSAPGAVLFEHFGFTPQAISARVLELLKR